MSEAGQYLIIQRQRISYEASRGARWGARAQLEDMPKEFRPHLNSPQIECTVTAIVDQLIFAVLVHPEDDERKYERILPKRDDEARKVSGRTYVYVYACLCGWTTNHMVQYTTKH
jgi:hypothetical protein